MSWIRQILIFFICLFAACLAQAANDPAGESLDEKLILSKKIWSPIFVSIDLEKDSQRLPMTKQGFQRVNELFYRAYADYLDEPELMVQEKMYRTGIGKKIAENMIRTLFGLQPLNLTYDSFSKKEKDEWELFSRENYTQMKQIENRMKGFTQFIQIRFAQKKPPPVHDTK